MTATLHKKYPDLFDGITDLHKYQEEAISNILGGINTLAIAPTGSGKSLIYQLAALELTGSTIVISPLVALINEQESFLKSKNISVLGLTGEIDFADQRKILRELAEKQPKLIFLSPERLHNNFFRAAIKKSRLNIGLLVIDEAHCISQWGIDFRPEYGEIDSFLRFVKDIGQTPTILALTATLGIEARKDILDEFGINVKNVLIEENIVRPELELNFVQVSKEPEKTSITIEILKKHHPKKALVYFYGIEKCKKFCEKLKEEGFNSDTFYSERKADDKKEVYNHFKAGEINVLCATTAFGMGMNIPDIDMVIHYHIPNSIEEYYQQVGRAARNRKICSAASCFLIWSETNIEHKITKEIPESQITLPKLVKAFKAMGLENKANSPMSMEYSDYLKQNLSLYRFLFEKHGILQTIGELNGTPRTIKFKKDNPYWQQLLKNMKIGNSYTRMAQNSNLSVQELIDYVFEQELTSHIAKFPALEKKIFFVSDQNTVPIPVAYQIIEESIEVIEFKKKQINALRELVNAEEPHLYIKKYLM